LQAVSSATTIIDPQPTARLDQFNDNTAFFYSSPWGSLVLENGPTYVVAFAEFNIPYAYADGLGGLASIWTGLGGWNGNQALIQAGVEFDYGGFFGSSYYAWIEYWTNNQINVSLGVSPSQELYDEVWASDSSGHVNAKGGWGAFYLKNLTTGSAIPIMGIQAPHPFVGATAESVIEAHPPAPLTDYISASMFWDAQDSEGVDHDLQTDFYWSDELTSSGLQLESSFDCNGVDETCWNFEQQQ
jgi:hypothetical protein